MDYYAALMNSSSHDSTPSRSLINDCDLQIYHIMTPQEQYNKIKTNMKTAETNVYYHINRIISEVKTALKALHPKYDSQGYHYRVHIYSDTCADRAWPGVKKIQKSDWTVSVTADDVDAFIKVLSESILQQITYNNVGDPTVILCDTFGAIETELRESLNHYICEKKVYNEEYDSLYKGYKSFNKNLTNLSGRYIEWLQYHGDHNCDRYDADLDNTANLFLGPYCDLTYHEIISLERNKNNSGAYIDDLEERYIRECCDLKLVLKSDT